MDGRYQVVEGMHKCVRCGKPKPHWAYHRDASRKAGVHSTCKTCRRLSGSALRTTEEYRRRRAAHLARPEVRERTREQATTWYRAHRVAHLSRQRERCSTVLGRLKNSLYKARSLLRRPASPARVAALHARLALIETEIARVRRSQEVA